MLGLVWETAEFVGEAFKMMFVFFSLACFFIGSAAIIESMLWTYALSGHSFRKIFELRANTGVLSSDEHAERINKKNKGTEIFKPIFMLQK